MQDIKISIVQSRIFWEDINQNLQHFIQKLSEIKEDTDIIVLPEMFTTGFSTETTSLAEDMNGKAVTWLKETAKEKQAVLCASIIFKEHERVSNRLFWVKPNGDMRYYDKRHLFRMGNEHKKFTAGQEKIICEHKGWKFCPLVCYDLRFPVWSKNTYLNQEYEYDCLIYIANWPASRTKAWKSLLVARAIENQSYCIGVNRIGKDVFQTAHQGDSIIIDPKGEMIYQAPKNTEEVDSLTLRKDILNNYRNKFQVALDWDRFKIE